MPNVRCRCGRLLTYAPEMAGRKARCPRCSVVMEIPAATLALQDELTPPKPPSSPTGPAAPPQSDPFDGKSSAPAYEPEVRERPAVPLAYAGKPSRLSAAPKVSEPPDDSFRGFTQALKGAVTFPFRGNAFISLLCGVVFFTLAGFATKVMSFFPLIGVIVALAVSLVLAGYAMGYLMNLARTSAHGEEDAPDWADLTDWQQNAAKPLLLFLGLLLLCFGAAGIYLLTHLTQNSPVVVLLAIPGAIYLPMGLLCVSLADGIAGLNPLLGVRAIAARPGRYVILCLLLAAVVVVQQLLQIGIGKLGVPILGRFAASFIGFYSLLLLGRIMGLFYRTGGEKLKWLAG